MVFSMAAVANASAEIAEADQHPNIRLFTVGQGSHTEYAAPDLQTIEQRWAVASHETVSNKQRFGYFSAVCYIFGRQLAAAVSTAASPLPIGLISSNWGGTPVEAWSPRAAFGACNRTEDPGQLYNAMIAPFTVGPMALTGATWCATLKRRCVHPPVFFLSALGLFELPVALSKPTASGLPSIDRCVRECKAASCRQHHRHTQNSMESSA